MNEKEIKGLESSDTWDLEAATSGRRTKPTRAIVSVAFKREEFELVSESAELVGMRTSEFIRTAALEKARPSGSSVSFYVSSGTAGFSFSRAELTPITDVTPRTLQYEQGDVLTVA